MDLLQRRVAEEGGEEERSSSTTLFLVQSWYVLGTSVKTSHREQNRQVGNLLD